MFYLLLAIASSTLISILMRLSNKHVRNDMAMFLANYSICLVLARLFIGGQALLPDVPGSGLAIGLGLVSGVLYLLSFMLMQQNMQKNGIVLSSTFMKLGVLVPTLMAIFLFHEQPGLSQTLGLLLALVAIVMIHFEKESLQQGQQKLWLILLLLLSGLSDAMTNIYDKTAVSPLGEHFLFYTFFAALLTTLAWLLCKRQKIYGKDLLFGLLIGVPNYFSSRFLLLALDSVPAVVAYPVYSAATLILISLSGLLLFKEQLSRRKAIALGIVIISLVLLNL